MGGIDSGESLVSLCQLAGRRGIPAAGLLFCPERWVARKRKRSAKCGHI
ncbi:hypothetical protein Cadr_000001000 [Camelus dromedarius]|uniref:Uncharacterized protein n=1 Tax=Camelus dromedarius TaxID=9838 RepID=A0A5N4EI33_CAMDR|nr:hypothetical protein Cadr_000001000 [Camelus dromedarius]